MSGYYATAEHPRRIAMLRAIEAQPGIGFRELARKIGIPHGGTAHHLGILERLGLAHTQTFQTRRVAFPGRKTARTPGDCMRARLTGGLLLAYEVACANPERTQKELLDLLSTMPRSTAQHRLERLCAAGLLEKTTAGIRGFSYRAVQV